MTERDFNELFEDVRAVLRPHLRRSEPLRRIVERVGAWLVEESRRAQTDGAEAAPREAEAPPRGTGAAPGARPAATVTLKIGDESMPVAVPGTDEEIERAEAAVAPAAGADQPRREAATEPEIDLALIERRCRLKADGCRLFIERRAAAGDHAAERPVLERMHGMIDQAKAVRGCFLWMFLPDAQQPPDAVLRTLGRCYDALADAAELLRRIGQHGIPEGERRLVEAMELAAEADSALRVALEDTWLTVPDTDQMDMHLWLRAESARLEIWIPRFMKLEDRADPAEAPEVIRRIAALGTKLDQHAAREKQIAETFNRIRYHAEQLGRRDADRHDSRKIAESIEALIDLGLPPADPRFREVLGPDLLDSLAADLASSSATDTVLERIAEWHEAAARPDPAEEAGPAPEWSERVLEVRDLLAGRKVVLIGGEPRRDAENRLREAFDLAGVEWVKLSEHGTGKPMIAPIMHPDTALVIVLIKLAGSLHSEEAKDYARDAGKPCVYAKAGYNPEQIAEAVLQQASEQLRQGAAAP